MIPIFGKKNGQTIKGDPIWLNHYALTICDKNGVNKI